MMSRSLSKKVRSNLQVLHHRPSQSLIRFDHQQSNSSSVETSNIDQNNSDESNLRQETEVQPQIEPDSIESLRRGLEQRLSGSAKLFDDALKEEEEEKENQRKRGFRPDPNDPVWTGEERVQDTVLRMLIDKHKPLRIRGSSGTSTDPVGDKLKTIQQPTKPGPNPSEDSLSSIFPFSSTPNADGTRLGRTPNNKPWAAKYIRPSHASGEAAIHYGKYLESTSTSSTFRSPSSSQTPSQRLKAAGISVSNLPVDDPKAMRQLREGIKRFEKAGKLERAREGVFDYKKVASGGGSRLKDLVDESQDGKEHQTTISRGRGSGLLMGGPQRWGSIVDERIREAQEAGFFKENKLRGKPLKRDINESNPYLKREEFFMNRMVKRQGAAPPWVELNIELERDLTGFRSRLQESWVRRATRMICSSPLHNLEPLPPPASSGPNLPLESDQDPDSEDNESGLISPISPGAEAKLVREIPAARTAGEQNLINLVTSYRDPEWIAQQSSFHSLEVDGLNSKLRKYNGIAPYHTRRGYLSKERELEKTLAKSIPFLIDSVSDDLRARLNRGQAIGTTDRSGRGSSRNRIFNFWGQEVSSDAKLSADDGMKAGFTASSTGGEGSRDSVNSSSKDSNHQRKSRAEQSFSGLGVLVRRTVDWVTSRVGV